VILDSSLRYADFSLSDDDLAILEAFGKFFQAECPTSRVRASEPLGFDRDLWVGVAGMGAASMGLPDELGDRASLLHLCLVSECGGQRLAPLPFVEVVAASRLLSQCSFADDIAAIIESVRAGTSILSLALFPIGDSPRQLVPAGAVADHVIALRGEDLLLLPSTGQGLAGNLGKSPLAWWDLAAPQTATRPLVSGPRAVALYHHAVAEWHILTAAGLVGLSKGALDMAVDFAKGRQAFGKAIGSFQAISHPLVDVAIAVDSARNLARKAAWFSDNERDNAIDFALLAFVNAARTANKATGVGIHTQGGFGYTLDSDMTLYFSRAKAWSVVGGDPTRKLTTVVQSIAARRKNAHP
jgi:alkylation response protein AidB-like acyl-CoA dehydrogenase